MYCNKAKKLTGIFYKKLYSFSSSRETPLKLYKTVIRPHLEYASQVWSPYLEKEIKSIEDVQKYALRASLHEVMEHKL